MTTATCMTQKDTYSTETCIEADKDIKELHEMLNKSEEQQKLEEMIRKYPLMVYGV